MAYVQSASATSAKRCQIIKKVGPRTILKNKKNYRDGFQKKIYQGPKPKFAIFAGIKNIF